MEEKTYKLTMSQVRCLCLFAIKYGTAPNARDVMSVMLGGKPAVPSQNLRATWEELIGDMLQGDHSSVASLLLNVDAVSDDGAVLVLQLPRGGAFTRRMLEREDIQEIVQGTVGEKFGPRTITYISCRDETGAHAGA